MMLVLSLALLPVFHSSISTRRQVFSLAKHVTASQLACSLMDRLQAMPFAECRTLVGNLGIQERPFRDDPFFGDALKQLQENLPPEQRVVGVGLNDFAYAIEWKELPAETPAWIRGQGCPLTVPTSWLEQPKNPDSRRTFVLKALKFNEAS